MHERLFGLTPKLESRRWFLLNRRPKDSKIHHGGNTQVNLADIIREAGYSAKDSQVQQDLKNFVNRSIRLIAERFNFTAIRDRRLVVIPSGFSSQKLGAEFKQLGMEDSPVSFTYGQYQLPVLVTSRERIQLAGIWPFPNGPFSFPVPGGYMPVRVVYFERNGPGGQWTLNTPPQFAITQNAEFWVTAYWYPFPLVKGEDTNPMTEDGNLSEAIVRLTVHYAFRAVNPTDPRGDAAKEQAEEAITRAIYSDAAISGAGRSWRM